MALVMWLEIVTMSQWVSASSLEKKGRVRITSDCKRNDSTNDAYGIKILNSDGGMSSLTSDAH